ncbi:MAG: hypothetical protein B0D92_08780 [Spirochaeta sp. LUC14_002_19_P3]|nr:MAG: hypothetical protein B0D92_08780 [Spirochaeta sp. LUC14_002_19_P3]
MKSVRWLSVFFLFVLFVGALGADEITVRLESRIIETWDGPDSGYFADTGEPITWMARGSKFSREEFPRTAYAMNEWPVDLFGYQPNDPETLGIFGVHGAFDRQGYNQIEIIPGVKDGDEFIAKPVPLPGQVQTLDFWVWGSNYDYYVEFLFQDYNGIVHRFAPYRNENRRAPGSVKFIGWKNMYITMPNYIKQASSSLGPALSLTKIIVTTHPNERVSGFYIYFDHIKVLTDIQNSSYDGVGLGDKQRIDEIWLSEE